MNRIFYWPQLLCVAALCTTLNYGEQPADRKAIEALNKKENLGAQQPTFTFSYTNEDLINILYTLAADTKTTLLLPQGANAINVKVTYDAGRPLSYDEAWNLAVSFLDVAGYATIKKDDSYQITKMNKEITREGLPVYIGTDILTAPDNDEQIVYVHYFNNMKASLEGSSEVQEILKLLFPEGAKFVIDSNKNAVIMAARARDIQIAVSILTELDKAGFKEKIDKLKLKHTSARFVADLFNEHFLPKEDPMKTGRLDNRKRAENSYFAPQTRIVAYDRLNMLIMIGQEQALERIKTFIQTQIDVELESGKSILHTYRLQYLEAESFAPVLQKIVEGGPAQTTGQSKTEGKRPAGPEKFFDEVIIAVDKPTKAEELHYYGGNNLIIACRNDDWNIIHDLIESMDTPQPQVFIEVLIADLTIEDQRILGSIMRNPASIPLPKGVEFQSAMIAPGVIVEQNAAGVNTTLDADLLQLQTNPTPPPPTTSFVVTDMQAGSTAIAFCDANGKTWTALQLLKEFTNSKIISHPHFIATHNRPVEAKIGQYRLVPGDVTGSIGSNTVQKFEGITADLKILITPRISAENTVNLDIKINIEEFIINGSNAKTTRELKTNANVESESILTLGGLVRTNTSQGFSKTPGLGDIPGLGWLFKTRADDRAEDNLTIFVCPTIIRQQARANMGAYTQDYIDLVHKYAEQSVLFDSVRDPITRMYFGMVDDFQKVVDDFVVEDQFIKQQAIMPEPKEKKETKKTETSLNPEGEAPEDNTTGEEPDLQVKLSKQAPATAIAKATLDKEIQEKIAHDENPFKRVEAVKA